MLITSRARNALVLLLGAASIAACSSGSHSPLAPTPAVSGATGIASNSKTASVTFSITVPRADSAHSRKPAYVSTQTRSAVLTITPTGTTSSTQVAFACTSSQCSQTVDAPTGSDTFAVALYDNGNGQGNLLSSGSVATTINAGQTNAVSVTFNPVLAGVALTNISPFIAGVPQTQQVPYTTKDPAGQTIIGPGSFENSSGAPTSLAFTSSDPGTHLTFSTTPITAPTTNPTLAVAYDGTPPRGHYTTTIAGVIPNVAATANSSVVETVDANFAHFYPVPQPAPSYYASYSSAPATGADGNVWFGQEIDASQSANGARTAFGRIEKVDVHTGTVTEYATPSQNRTRNYVLGSDGNIWFSEYDENTQKAPESVCYVGNITPSGTITEIPLPYANTTQQGSTQNPYCGLEINGYDYTSTLGPDGNMWYTGYFISPNVPVLLKVTPSGTITVFTVGAKSEAVRQISSGPNNRVYYIKTSGSSVLFASTDTNGNSTQTTLGNGYVTSYGPLIYASDGTFYLGSNHISAAGALLASAFSSSSNPCNARLNLPDGTLFGDSSGAGAICNIGSHAVVFIPTKYAASTTYGSSETGYGGVTLGGDGNLWLTGVYSAGAQEVVW